VTVLRDLSKGVADLPLAEVARVAQELLVKQMRQSFQSEQSPDEDPWPVRKRPSFAGVLKLSRKALLHYKATGETKFFGRDALPWSESFLAQRAYSIVARGKATKKGLEVHGSMQTYFGWQNEGTTKTGWGPPIPARPFWGFGADLLDVVNALVADKAVQAVAGK